MSIQIQPANPEHADALTAIAHSAKRHWGYPDQWIDAWHEDLTITPEYLRRHAVFLAVADGTPVGCVAIEDHPTHWSIEHLWLQPDHHGRDIGRLLFQHALRVTESDRRRDVHVAADPHAAGFYRRMGARYVGELPAPVAGTARTLPCFIYRRPWRDRMPIIQRPDPSEYAPYYGTYVDQLPAGDVIDQLETHGRDTAALLAGIPEDRAGFRYAPGKWSLKEVVGHLTDTERIFAYRALRFSRADRTPIPGFEQDDYVAAANFDGRTLADLAAEFAAVRAASLALFKSLDDTALARRGTANDVEFSARSIPFIIAGHERHHLGVLRERYLPGITS